MLIHEQALVKIDRDMPLDKAALIGCGVTTGLGAVFRTARVAPGETVAVIGCGGIGLSAVQGARIAGANKIIAIDMAESKLELAQQMGATHVVNASSDDVVAAVKDLTGGGVHHSFEAVGLKQTAEQAYEMLRNGGQATVIGMIPVGTKIEIHGPELLYEKKLTGSNMGSNQFRTDMPRFVDMYLDGRLQLDEMVSKTITLEQINDGFADMKTGNVARSVIMFDWRGQGGHLSPRCDAPPYAVGWLTVGVAMSETAVCGWLAHRWVGRRAGPPGPLAVAHRGRSILHRWIGEQRLPFWPASSWPYCLQRSLVVARCNWLNGGPRSPPTPHRQNRSPRSHRSRSTSPAPTVEHRSNCPASSK